MRAADRLATDPCVLSQARDDGGDSDERGLTDQRRATDRQHGRQPLDAGVWPTRTGLDARRTTTARPPFDRSQGHANERNLTLPSAFAGDSDQRPKSAPDRDCQSDARQAARAKTRGRVHPIHHRSPRTPAAPNDTPRIGLPQITAANRPPPPSRPRSPFSSAILACLRHVHCHSARRGLSADASLGQRGPDGRGASPGPKRVRHVFRRGQGFSRPRSPFLFIALTRRAHSSRDFTAGLARRSSGERRGRSTLSARARGWLSS